MIQTEFLKILEAFMHDSVYRMPEGFSDIQKLYQTAAEHKMTAAVYEMIRNDAVVKQTADVQTISVWRREAMKDVMLQIQRTEGFLVLYQKLCEAELKPLIVKGLICRNLYTRPDYRVSGDEDILISKKDFQICDAILRREGFRRGETEVDDPEKLPYELPYINPQNGVYIELHFALFPEESGVYGHLNGEFENVSERSVCEKVQGRNVWTLCPTDHLFYLICHSFKHFLHSGFGLRQVCDMVMMAEKYGRQIDWQEIKDKLVRLNMNTYWNALLNMSEAHLGMSFERAAYPERLRDIEVDYEPILQDLMKSGIYGDSTMERRHSSNMTLAAAQSGRKDTAASIRLSLFPGVDYMKKQFAWLDQHAWLLPAAYILRIVRYLKTARNKDEKGQNEQNSVQIGIERIELLRKYNIIK